MRRAGWASADAAPPVTFQPPLALASWQSPLSLDPFVSSAQASLAYFILYTLYFILIPAQVSLAYLQTPSLPYLLAEPTHAAAAAACAATAPSSVLHADFTSMDNLYLIL